MRTSFAHRMMNSSVLVILLALSVTISPAHAQSDQTDPEPARAAQTSATTHLISFQGRLLTPGTGVPKPDAVYAMTFVISTASSGPASWSENKNVLVSKGTFSTLLGDTTPLILSDFNGQDLWLGMLVSGEELLPRQRLAYTPYSLYASSAGNATMLAGNAPNAFAAASHSHDGGAITSGTVAEPRIDPALARDSEVVPLVSSSGAFAATSHSHMGETWAGSAPLIINGSTDGIQVSASDVGIRATGGSSGFYATSSNYGVYLENVNYSGFVVINAGVFGLYVGASSASGVYVGNTNSHGLEVNHSAGDGVNVARAGSPVGAAIANASSNGVEVQNAQGSGVYVGHSDGNGVHVESGGFNGGYFNTAVSNGNGIAGIANNGTSAYGVFGSSTSGYAGYFSGKVHVAGTLTKSGGAFKIDHPLDPANKYLYHSFVESPDMKNIYDGVVMLDANGTATVQLPEWFEALNEEFRYQLTCIGGYAPVYIAEEVNNNQFKIAGGSTGLKVSWQVTGIRHDPYAEANRIVVEELKAPEDQGRYLFPAGYGQPRSLAPAALLEKPMPQQPVIVNPGTEGSQPDGGKP